MLRIAPKKKASKQFMFRGFPIFQDLDRLIQTSYFTIICRELKELVVRMDNM